MRAKDIKEMLKAQPFSPVLIGLSDGRSILVRHPDQVVVSDRFLFAGLTRLRRSQPQQTPATSEEVAREGVFVNLLQITTVEVVNGNGRKPRRTKPRAGK